MAVHGKLKGAHRLSWEIHYGPIPDGMFVCHRCDNRGCVRPDHLFLGTHSDNMCDAYAKGRIVSPALRYPERLSRGDNHYARREPERLARGIKHGNSLLQPAHVVQAHELRATGLTHKQIAERLGIGKSSVGRILRGEAWVCR
jgi:hypothetical protein